MAAGCGVHIAARTFCGSQSRASRLGVCPNSPVVFFRPFRMTFRPRSRHHTGRCSWRLCLATTRAHNPASQPSAPSGPAISDTNRSCATTYILAIVVVCGCGNRHTRYRLTILMCSRAQQCIWHRRHSKRPYIRVRARVKPKHDKISTLVNVRMETTITSP